MGFFHTHSGSRPLTYWNQNGSDVYHASGWKHKIIITKFISQSGQLVNMLLKAIMECYTKGEDCLYENRRLALRETDRAIVDLTTLEVIAKATIIREDNTICVFHKKEDG